MSVLIFLVGVFLCVGFGKNIIFAMLFGLAVFSIHALILGHKPREVAKMAFLGAKKASNILILFVLIGMITGVWRASGVISYIVFYSARLISPSFFVASAFLLASGMSILTGTSFGTASTMGTVMMIVAGVNGAPLPMTAGALLAGAFFGDRCSPVSSSARLICDVSKTDYYENIGRWIKTGLLPLILSLAMYAILGSKGAQASIDTSITELFSQAFTLSWLCILPAASILILSIFKVNVRKNMLFSLVLSAILALFIQKMPPMELLKALWYGYGGSGVIMPEAFSQIAKMLAGGGITSMFKAAGIVAVSSCFIGIFDGTDMLSGFVAVCSKLGKGIGRFAATALVSTAASALSCNQTLSIMLTSQLVRSNYVADDGEIDGKALAGDLADTASVIPPLIPWSIASAIPLAVMGASASALPFAFYLYLVPLFGLFRRK